MRIELTAEEKKRLERAIAIVRHPSDDDLRAFLAGELEPIVHNLLIEAMAQDEQLVERLADINVDYDAVPDHQTRMLSAARQGLDACLDLAKQLSKADRDRLGRYMRQWHGFMAYAQYRVALKLKGIVRYSQPLPIGARASQGLDTKEVEPNEQLDRGSVGLVLVQDRLVRAKVFQRPQGFLVELELQVDHPGVHGEVVSDGEAVLCTTTPTQGGIVVDFIVEPGKEYYIDLVDVDSEMDQLDSGDICVEQLGVEDRLVLDSAMSQLGDLERQVLTHFYFDSMTQVEIAAKLEMSGSNVSHILHQSHAKLRKILRQEQDGDRVLRRDAEVD